MAKYEAWENGELPCIESHSQRKHDVVREYLKQYIRVVGGRSFHRSTLTLTLVDGFAGGGLYTTPDGLLHLGSPLILLDTAYEIEAELKLQKQFTLDAQFVFIEKNGNVLDYLRKTLTSRQYGKQIGTRIHLLDREFESNADKVTQFILKRKDRAHRCIFLLDQYGYNQVAIKRLSQIFTELPNAEIILTFAVDYLIDYLSESGISDDAMKGFGLNLTAAELLQEKKNQKHWRHFIQKRIYARIVEDSGCRHFTNFFIKSREDNKAYWLLHLSMHPMARDEMLALHWKLKNHFQHEGKAGLFMLGYDPEKEQDPKQLPFAFAPRDKEITHNSLLEELPCVIPKDGAAIKQLYKDHCNLSTATIGMFREALLDLHRLREIEVLTPGGRKKRTDTISDDDTIFPKRQLFIDFCRIKKAPRR